VTAGIDEQPSEFLTMRPLPKPPSAGGIGLRVLKIRRDNGEWIPRPKSLNCLNSMLGAREMLARGASPSDEGLFLSRAGELVVETVRQNIAWIVGDRIHIPDASVGAVAGTGLAWMQTCGVAIAPARATLAELLRAEAIFVLNSVRGITPVAEVWDASDVRRLGVYSSASHPLVIALQQDWREALERSAKATAR
jgi:branched-subunit amino acid aminotransferase/4-amino-4-deoxychorismate lyase